MVNMKKEEYHLFVIAAIVKILTSECSLIIGSLFFLGGWGEVIELLLYFKIILSVILIFQLIVFTFIIYITSAIRWSQTIIDKKIEWN